MSVFVTVEGFSLFPFCDFVRVTVKLCMCCSTFTCSASKSIFLNDLFLTECVMLAREEHTDNDCHGETRVKYMGPFIPEEK